ncbi:hypothetical protein P9112_014215 [Eukaryota sp. TZLM1-RC]
MVTTTLLHVHRDTLFTISTTSQVTSSIHSNHTIFYTTDSTLGVASSSQHVILHENLSHPLLSLFNDAPVCLTSQSLFFLSDDGSSIMKQFSHKVSSDVVSFVILPNIHPFNCLLLCCFSHSKYKIQGFLFNSNSLFIHQDPVFESSWFINQPKVFSASENFCICSDYNVRLFSNRFILKNELSFNSIINPVYFEKESFYFVEANQLKSIDFNSKDTSYLIVNQEVDWDGLKPISSSVTLPIPLNLIGINQENLFQFPEFSLVVSDSKLFHFNFNYIYNKFCILNGLNLDIFGLIDGFQLKSDHFLICSKTSLTLLDSDKNSFDYFFPFETDVFMVLLLSDICQNGNEIVELICFYGDQISKIVLHCRIEDLFSFTIDITNLTIDLNLNDFEYFSASSCENLVLFCFTGQLAVYILENSMFTALYTWNCSKIQHFSKLIHFSENFAIIQSGTFLLVTEIVLEKGNYYFKLVGDLNLSNFGNFHLLNSTRDWSLIHFVQSNVIGFLDHFDPSSLHFERLFFPFNSFIHCLKSISNTSPLLFTFGDQLWLCFYEFQSDYRVPLLHSLMDNVVYFPTVFYSKLINSSFLCQLCIHSKNFVIQLRKFNHFLKVFDDPISLHSGVLAFQPCHFSVFTTGSLLNFILCQVLKNNCIGLYAGVIELSRFVAHRHQSNRQSISFSFFKVPISRVFACVDNFISGISSNQLLLYKLSNDKIFLANTVDFDDFGVVSIQIKLFDDLFIGLIGHDPSIFKLFKFSQFCEFDCKFKSIELIIEQELPGFQGFVDHNSFFKIKVDEDQFFTFDPLMGSLYKNENLL